MQINRIAVALDGSPLSIATMDQAAEMAERIKASVALIFVENADLKSIVGSDHIRIVSPFAEAGQGFSRGEVDDILKSQRIRLRRSVDYAFRGHKAGHELIVATGRIQDELLKNSETAELLIMGWTGWKAADYYFSVPYVQGNSRHFFPAVNKISLSKITRGILRQRRHATMVMVEPIAKNSQILAYFDGSEAAKGRLDFAVKILAGMLGQGKYPYRRNTAANPLNIVTKKELADGLRGFLGEIEADANIIVGNDLSLATLDDMIKLTGSKLLLLAKDDGLDAALDMICRTPVSFMLMEEV